MATDIKKIAECGKGEALEGRQVRLLRIVVVLERAWMLRPNLETCASVFIIHNDWSVENQPRNQKVQCNMRAQIQR